MTSGGILRVGTTFTANFVNSFIAGAGTIDYNGSDQTVAGKNGQLGSNYFNLVLSGSGIKTVDDVWVDNIISMKGTATANVTSANDGINAGTNSTLRYEGGAAQVTGPEFGQSLSSVRIFDGTGGVIINNTNGVTLGNDCSIGSILNIAIGNLSIGNNILTLKHPITGSSTYADDNLVGGATSSLKFENSTENVFVPKSITALKNLSYTCSTGSFHLSIHSNLITTSLLIAGKIFTLNDTLTAGSTNLTGLGGYKYVYGFLRHLFPIVPTGNQSIFFFPIGDADNYTPVNVVFSKALTGGYLCVYTTAGLHTLRAGAGLNDATICKRWWTINKTGLANFIYSATFSFVSGDVPTGDVPTNFSTQNYIVRKYSASAGWLKTGNGNHSAYSAQGTGMTSFSDYILGQGIADASKSELTVLPNSIVADGITTAKLTVTAKDSNGDPIGGGASVSITNSGGDGLPTTVVDNHNGTYDAFVSWDQISHGHFVATLDGNPVMNGGTSQTEVTVDYTLGPGSGLTSILTPTISTINADGTSNQVLTVKVYDLIGR